MKRPDWKDAPSWARYVAQSANGDWRWYECKPRWTRRGWVTPAGFGFAQAQVGDTQHTLEKRP